MRFDELRVGLFAERSRTVSELDVQRFADVSGDFNPVHLDEQVAAKSRFGTRIAHGMLSASFISAALAMEMPGANSIYLSQSLKFTRPVKLGDTVTTRVEIMELLPKNRARIATTCRNQIGEAVIEGEALILIPEESG